MSDFKAKMHQNPKFGWGSAPDPAGGAFAIILALCVSNAGIASTRMDKSSQFLTNWQVYHSSLLNPTAVTKF